MSAERTEFRFPLQAECDEAGVVACTHLAREPRKPANSVGHTGGMDRVKREDEAVRDPHPRPPAWLADTTVAAVLVISAFAPSPGESYLPPTLLSLILVGVCVVILPLRRRWPVTTLILVALVFGLSALSSTLSAGTALAVAVAMFGVTNKYPRGTGLLVTGATVAFVAGSVLLAAPDEAIKPRAVQFALAVVVGAAVGDATKSRRGYFAAMNERAVRAEQTREAEARRRVSEERVRIARDLHDVVAHQISVISLNAGVASTAIDSNVPRAKEALAAIRIASRTVLGEIGGLLEILRSDDDAHPTAPQPDLDRLDDLIRAFAESDLDVTVRIEGDLAGIPSAVGLVAYRIIQESLTNAHKHGTSGRAHVLLSIDASTLTVVVTNPASSDLAAGPGARLGLTGLRERVATLRGTFEAGAAPGGWRVTAHLPLTTGPAA
jgi:signal transduction histidine kinase